MTKYCEVRGLVYDGKKFKPKTVTVRATADSSGKSISFSDDKSVMIHVAIEDVEDLLSWVLNE